ncbi:hypothetical protein VNO77_03019 [Canavalia gladiata]|uniref:Uncharacterized protein n=1 Tax=Canavalia gladiata TaxID=3824 RepID=A0AAN9R6K3_CANGL
MSLGELCKSFLAVAASVAVIPTGLRSFLPFQVEHVLTRRADSVLRYIWLLHQVLDKEQRETMCYMMLMVVLREVGGNDECQSPAPILREDAANIDSWRPQHTSYYM